MHKMYVFHTLPIAAHTFLEKGDYLITLSDVPNVNATLNIFSEEGGTLGVKCIGVIEKKFNASKQLIIGNVELASNLCDARQVYTGGKPACTLELEQSDILALYADCANFRRFSTAKLEALYNQHHPAPEAYPLADASPVAQVIKTTSDATCATQSAAPLRSPVGIEAPLTPNQAGIHDSNDVEFSLDDLYEFSEAEERVRLQKREAYEKAEERQRYVQNLSLFNSIASKPLQDNPAQFQQERSPVMLDEVYAYRYTPRHEDHEEIDEISFAMVHADYQTAAEHHEEHHRRSVEMFEEAHPTPAQPCAASAPSQPFFVEPKQRPVEDAVREPTPIGDIAEYFGYRF